jgi:hypothetical protein
LIDHRDKLKLDLNEIETSLSERLKKKYQLLFKNAVSTPPSAEFQSLEMEVHSPCNDGILKIMSYALCTVHNLCIYVQNDLSLCRK